MDSLYSMLVDISQAFGVRVSVHDVSGITYTSRALELPYEWKSHTCNYCRAVKQAVSEQYCMHQKEIALWWLRSTGVKPYYGICAMGVCEYLQPVFCEGSLVAIVFASGVAEEDEEKARMRAARHALGQGADPTAVLACFDGFAARCHTTRRQLQFFAELVAEQIQRDATISGIVRPPQGEYPVEAVRKRNAGLSNDILVYMDHNFHMKLSLQGIASVFFISEGHLNRLVHRETGMSVMNYIRHLRISAAMRELTRSDKPIYEIAHQSGFSDVNYFCRCFRASLGETPSHYRETHAQ